eukprot:TRINITY_DN15846_c0_g1_i1.p1 TRINITY_DN15846_c0_g1~~TRINITY_DN15846_c0_g1_i1.p1  ORF type:complete len:368 (-),score=135.70 TRINITY_DN15846_c0_g1_i1:279-1382(-)
MPISRQVGDEDKYSLGPVIGRGTSCEVRSALNRSTLETVAIKIVSKKDEFNLKRVRYEVAILQKLAHPNIIRLRDTFENSVSIFLVFDKLEKSLWDFCVEKGKLDEELSHRIFSQVADAVQYLHVNNIAHLDIKSPNIMLTADLKPVLIDFGISMELKHNAVTTVRWGSYAFMSPEITREVPVDPKKCDVWALGVTLYNMVSGVLPFNEKNHRRLFDLIERGYLYIPHFLSTPVTGLLRQMMDRNPDRRLDIDAIVQYCKSSWLPAKSGVTALPRIAPLTLAVPSPWPAGNRVINHSQSFHASPMRNANPPPALAASPSPSPLRSPAGGLYNPQPYNPWNPNPTPNANPYGNPYRDPRRGIRNGVVF